MTICPMLPLPWRGWRPASDNGKDMLLYEKGLTAMRQALSLLLAGLRLHPVVAEQPWNCRIQVKIPPPCWPKT